METAKKSGWNSCRRPTRELSVNPNGIASSSPRLARQRLPWVTDYQIINRNAVVVNIARRMEMEWPQPRCGWGYFADDDPG
jgi:hypothetical protein